MFTSLIWPNDSPHFDYPPSQSTVQVVGPERSLKSGSLSFPLCNHRIKFASEIIWKSGYRPSVSVLRNMPYWLSAWVTPNCAGCRQEWRRPTGYPNSNRARVVIINISSVNKFTGSCFITLTQRAWIKYIFVGITPSHACKQARSLIGGARAEEDHIHFCLSPPSLPLYLSMMRMLGPNSVEKFWLEFWLEKSLEFCLEIPYTKKMLKNG